MLVLKISDHLLVLLFMIDSCEYFAPLSSPKPKYKTIKNTLDLIKIDNGDLGVINFNNMVPVTNKNYVLFDLNKKCENEVLDLIT